MGDEGVGQREEVMCDSRLERPSAYGSVEGKRGVEDWVGCVNDDLGHG